MVKFGKEDVIHVKILYCAPAGVERISTEKRGRYLGRSESKTTTMKERKREGLE